MLYSCGMSVLYKYFPVSILGFFSCLQLCRFVSFICISFPTNVLLYAESNRSFRSSNVDFVFTMIHLKVTITNNIVKIQLLVGNNSFNVIPLFG